MQYLLIKLIFVELCVRFCFFSSIVITQKTQRINKGIPSLDKAYVINLQNLLT
jgi:hypothetical protein